MASPLGSAQTYRERLRPPWWLWAVTWFLVLTFGVAVLAMAGELPGVLAVVLLGASATYGLVRSGAWVAVEDGHLTAGPARIPVGDLGAARPLEAAQARLARGRDADPAAYHLLRPWVEAAAVFPVTDRRDPTPYWYVATRHPDALARALTAAQDHAADAARAAHPRTARRLGRDAAQDKA